MARLQVRLGIPSARTWWLIAALAGMTAIHAHYYHPYFGIDDSNITQVYACNLIHGHGWTYHPGTERVEGTTSFLYTLIWAAAFLLPWPHLMMHLLNLVFCIVACWAALATVRCLRQGDPQGEEARGIDVVLMTYILWIALNPGVLSWLTITLMDASVWTAVVLVAVYFTARFAQDGDATRYSRRMSVVVPLLVATRPEALLLAPVLLLLAGGVAYVAGGSLRKALEAVRAPGHAFVLTAGGMSLGRLAYFGYPLTNTYYAKLSPDFMYNITTGFKYIVVATRIAPLLLPLLGVGLILLWQSLAQLSAKKPCARQPLALGVVLGAMAILMIITVLNGGDHFAQGRFLVQVMLLAPLPILAALPERAWVPMRRFGIIAICTAWLLMAFVIDRRQIGIVEETQSIAPEFEIAEAGMQTGGILNGVLPPGPPPTLGVIAAGGIARTYPGYVVDLLGINNTLVAHSRGYRYGMKNHASFSQTAFYQLMPDMAFPCLFTADTPDSTRCQEHYELIDHLTHGFRRDGRFLNTYEFVELSAPNAAGIPLSPLPNGPPPDFRWMAPPPRNGPSGLRIFIKRSLVPSLRLHGLELRQP